MSKVYLHKQAAADELPDRVSENSRMDYHLPGQEDEYVGRIESDASVAQAGAAFLLLV